MFTYDNFSPDIQDCSTSGLIFVVPLTYIFISQKMRSKIKLVFLLPPEEHIVQIEQNFARYTGCITRSSCFLHRLPQMGFGIHTNPPCFPENTTTLNTIRY